MNNPGRVLDEKLVEEIIAKANGTLNENLAQDMSWKNTIEGRRIEILKDIGLAWVDLERFDKAQEIAQQLKNRATSPAFWYADSYGDEILLYAVKIMARTGKLEEARRASLYIFDRYGQAQALIYIFCNSKDEDDLARARVRALKMLPDAVGSMNRSRVKACIFSLTGDESDKKEMEKEARLNNKNTLEDARTIFEIIKVLVEFGQLDKARLMAGKVVYHSCAVRAWVEIHSASDNRKDLVEARKRARKMYDPFERSLTEGLIADASRSEVDFERLRKLSGKLSRINKLDARITLAGMSGQDSDFREAGEMLSFLEARIKSDELSKYQGMIAMSLAEADRIDEALEMIGRMAFAFWKGKALAGIAKITARKVKLAERKNKIKLQQEG